jgi:hypothetical protein
MPKRTLGKDVPADVTSKIYRVIVTQMMADPILGGAVKKWQTWDGEPTDITPPTPSSAPWIGLTPRPVSEAWFSPESQQGFLYIQIKALVRGTCIDDVLDLWGAIRHALSPYATGTGSTTFMQKLIAAGAPKGLVEMSQPISDPAPEAGQDGAFYAVGQLRVEYRALARS